MYGTDNQFFTITLNKIVKKYRVQEKSKLYMHLALYHKALSLAEMSVFFEELSCIDNINLIQGFVQKTHR
jgi:hypothetical protein